MSEGSIHIEKITDNISVPIGGTNKEGIWHAYDMVRFKWLCGQDMPLTERIYARTGTPTCEKCLALVRVS